MNKPHTHATAPDSGRQVVTITDAAQLGAYLRKCAPASTPVIFYGASNCAFVIGNYNKGDIYINGNYNTMAKGASVNGVPIATMDTINAVIDRQSKTIERLINLVKVLTDEVNGLQSQIANK